MSRVIIALSLVAIRLQIVVFEQKEVAMVELTIKIYCVTNFLNSIDIFLMISE